MRDTAVADTSPSSASTLWRAAIRQLSVKGLRRTPPIWREGRALPELVALRRDPIASGVGLPAGHGRPVFLIPGYMAGDASLAPLANCQGPPNSVAQVALTPSTEGSTAG